MSGRVNEGCGVAGGGWTRRARGLSYMCKEQAACMTSRGAFSPARLHAVCFRASGAPPKQDLHSTRIVSRYDVRNLR